MKEFIHSKEMRSLIIAFRIAVGSSIAILLAEMCGLEFASSAGIITLLSVLTTRNATLKLAWSRIISLLMTVGISWLLFMNIGTEWIVYGLFLFLLVSISHLAGWKDTISVNAVIGTHFMASHNFGVASILNEFYLVVIGVSAAIILNLFHHKKSRRQKLVADMSYIEAQLQAVLTKMADYLLQKEIEGSVWDDIIKLEEHLEHSVERAFEYRGNSFASHPEYYIHYMDMRTKQCNVLHNLHYQMKRIRTMPREAEIIAFYITYMKSYVTECNDPGKQLDELHKIVDSFRTAPLPQSREEFEGRAMLYHILMDLEEFLVFKRRFVDALSTELKEIYWKQEEQLDFTIDN